MFKKRLLLLPLLMGGGLYALGDSIDSSKEVISIDLSTPIKIFSKPEDPNKSYPEYDYIKPKDFIEYISRMPKFKRKEFGSSLYRELKYLQTFENFNFGELDPLPASENIDAIGKNLINRLQSNVLAIKKNRIDRIESFEDKEKLKEFLAKINSDQKSFFNLISEIHEIARDIEKYINEPEVLKEKSSQLEEKVRSLSGQAFRLNSNYKQKSYLTLIEIRYYKSLVNDIEKTIAQLAADFNIDPTSVPAARVPLSSSPLDSSLETSLGTTNPATGNTDTIKGENTNTTKDPFLSSYAEIKAYVQMAQRLVAIKKEVTKIIQNEQDTLFKLSSNMSSNMNKLNFASSLATSARLAKLSNPKAKDMEFARWIERIKNQHLADNAAQASNTKNNATSTNYLSNTIYAYDYLRFNHTHNVWGNIGTIIGNSEGINSASGVLSLGYDTWIKNMILGAYGSYSYTSNDVSSIDSRNKSHNGDLGLYSRFFIGNNEIDLSLGENIGFNIFSFKETLSDTALGSNYLSLQTHLDLTYGYVFHLNKSWFLKPFVGVNYNYGYNLGVNAGDDDVSMGWDGFQTHFISAQAGVEVRKYTSDNESYFFIAPAFYQGALLNNTQSIQTKIYGIEMNKGVNEFNKDNNLDTSFLLKVGGEWKIKENIYVNIAAGTKLGNINQYGMLNIGGRWVF